MITLPSRIVLCGVSGSGKSTLGDKLLERYGHLPTAFADPLKRAVADIFGFSDDVLWGHSDLRNTPNKKFVFSGFCLPCQVDCHGPERFAYASTLKNEQWHELLLKEHENKPDYWLCPVCGARYGKYVTAREALKTLGTEWGRRFCEDLWATSCLASMDPEQSYVVTDCRFDNERTKSLLDGACVVLLKRKLAESTSPHPSEAEVRAMAADPALFDIVLDNTEGSADENFDKLIASIDALRIGSEERPAYPIKWKLYQPKEEETCPFAP